MVDRENGIVMRETRHGVSWTAQTSRVVVSDLRKTDLFGIFKARNTERVKLAPTDCIKLHNGYYLVVAPIKHPDDPLELHICYLYAVYGKTGRWHADRYMTVGNVTLNEGDVQKLTSIGLLHGNVDVEATVINRGISVK